MIKITLPFTDDIKQNLKAGDAVELSGIIYTARDAAHKRLCSLVDDKGDIPVNLKGAAIYYAGPTPAKPGQIIGSCGPTSAVRMNAYAPKLYDIGVSCVIAKGPVSEPVRQSIIKNKAVYFCAPGGCGALLSECVVSAEEVAFSDLGTESIKRLEVKDMPLIVAIDSSGGTLFK